MSITLRTRPSQINLSQLRQWSLSLPYTSTPGQPLLVEARMEGLEGRISGVLKARLCPPVAQGMYIYVKLEDSRVKDPSSGGLLAFGLARWTAVSK